MLHALEYDLTCGIVDVCKKLFNKVFLQLLASADDRLCLIGTEKLEFTSVTFYILSDQITFILSLSMLTETRFALSFRTSTISLAVFEFRVIGQKLIEYQKLSGAVSVHGRRFAHAFIGQEQFP